MWSGTEAQPFSAPGRERDLCCPLLPGSSLFLPSMLHLWLTCNVFLFNIQNMFIRFLYSLFIPKHPRVKMLLISTRRIFSFLRAHLCNQNAILTCHHCLFCHLSPDFPGKKHTANNSTLLTTPWALAKSNWEERRFTYLWLKDNR